MISERSRAGAEWVNAPIEIHSIPVRASAPSVCSVTPPLASLGPARHLLDGCAQLGLVHVVQQQARRAGRERLLDLLLVAYLDLECAGQLRRQRTCTLDRLGDTARGGDVVLLDQDRVV